MYFATMEHYYDEFEDCDRSFIHNKIVTYDYLENYVNACFICYEEQYDSKNKIVKLFQHGFFIKNCSCKGNIHINCFSQWYKINKTCPICRSEVIKYETFIIDAVHKYLNNIVLFKIYINNLHLLFFKKLALFLIILQIYITIYNEVYNRSTQYSPQEL